MKITIELTDAEVKGIKAYLKEVGDIKRPTKADIASEISSYVQAIHAPSCAISDYIREAEREERKDADNVSKAPYYLD